MDVKALAALLAPILAGGLPYLVKLGESAAEEAGKRALGATWDTAKAVWERLRGKIKGDPVSAGMVAEIVAEEVAREDAEEMLRPRLKRLLADDRALLEALSELLAAAGPSVHHEARNVGSGAIAQDRGVAGGAGSNVVGGDQHIHQEYHTHAAPLASPAEDTTLGHRYLRWVMTQSAGLSLSALETSERCDPRQSALQLRAVYTALMTEATRQEPRAHGAEQDARRPLSALEVLNEEQRLVLHGELGSGKSTFVNFLSLCMAGELLDDPTANLALLSAPLPDEEGDDQDERQPWEHGALLPVKVILRDFAASGLLPAKAKNASSKALWGFIEQDLSKAGYEGYASALQKVLAEEGGLVLLDGLDEVAEKAGLRERVRLAVQAFAGDYDRCRFLVTVRSYAYQKPAWRLQRFRSVKLARLGPEQIRRFVDRWYTHNAELGRVDERNAAGRASLLKEVIFNRPRLRELAERPLLLTLMAHLHAERNQDLPERRAELYEEILQLLLKRWEGRLIELDEQGRCLEEQESLAEWLRVGPERVRTALEQLAYGVHACQEELRDTADIAERDLRDALLELNPDVDLRPGRLVEHLRDRTGVLHHRGEGVYTFPHRSFQEYLAACHLTSERAEFPEEVAALGRKDPDRWREVVLLAAGRGLPKDAWELAGELCPEPPGARPSAEQEWGAQLAAQVLVECADLQRVQPRNQGRRNTIRDWLAERIVPSTQLPARERSLAGRNLARLGDPRFDSEHWHLPADPLLGFRVVPAGAFSMGSDPERDSAAGDEELPQHSVDLPGFYLARWPVTVAQFRAFVEAEDYTEHDPNALSRPENEPVVYVSWYDAQAYCQWLDQRLRSMSAGRLAGLEGEAGEARAFWAGLNEGKLHAGLPSEAEWEKAARGSDGRLYPWGEEPDPEKANYAHTGLNGTSPVGCFPKGRSPYGCEDMSGNVWEWTRSLWGEDWEKPDFPYPYDPRDGREVLSAGDEPLRVLRGGSFFYLAELVRCAYRSWDSPNHRGSYFGFRVVVSPFFSEL